MAAMRIFRSWMLQRRDALHSQMRFEQLKARPLASMTGRLLEKGNQRSTNGKRP